MQLSLPPQAKAGQQMALAPINDLNTKPKKLTQDIWRQLLLVKQTKLSFRTLLFSLHAQILGFADVCAI